MMSRRFLSASLLLLGATLISLGGFFENRVSPAFIFLVLIVSISMRSGLPKSPSPLPLIALPALAVMITFDQFSWFGMFLAVLVISIVTKSPSNSGQNWFVALAPEIMGGLFMLSSQQSNDVPPQTLLGFFFRGFLLGSCLSLELNIDLKERLKKFGRKMELGTSLLALVPATLVLVGFWPKRQLSAEKLSNYGSASGGIRFIGWEYSPNAMSALLGIALLSTIFIWFRAIRRPDLRPIYYLLIATAAALIYLCSTRSTYWGLIGALSLFLIVNARKSLRKTLWITILGTALFGLVSIESLASGRAIFVGSEDGSSIYRQVTISTLWDRFLSGFTTPIGAGLYSGNALNPSALTNNIPVFDNSYFYIVAGFGVVGAAFFLFLLIKPFFENWRTYGSRQVFLLYFALIAIFENIVSWPEVLIFFFVISRSASD